jgi:hypothetical protein
MSSDPGIGGGARQGSTARRIEPKPIRKAGTVQCFLAR